MDSLIVEGVSKIGEATIGASGGGIDLCRAFHVQGLVRSFVVKLLEKVIELGLLLQTVHACGASGFGFEGQVHAFMPAVLLRMTGLDALDGDA